LNLSGDDLYNPVRISSLKYGQCRKDETILYSRVKSLCYTAGYPYIPTDQYIALHICNNIHNSYRNPTEYVYSLHSKVKTVYILIPNEHEISEI
jgi:hypothetical protein